jgi:asparagine synthase (glutamine-hydrolysing)
MKYGGKLAHIPVPFRKVAAMAMESIPSGNIPYLRSRKNFHSRYDKIKNLLNNPSPADYLKSLSKVFTDKEISEIFKQPVTELITAHHSSELAPAHYDVLSYVMAVDYQTYLSDDILQKVDRATMSVSLEGREPFLDQDIIEWAAQLPSAYKYHKGEKKYILKQIVHKYIPKALMERPKMGFKIPVEDWLGCELKDLVKEYLSAQNLGEHGLFEVNRINAIVNGFLNGRKEKYLKIWHLLMFQMWYKRWMQI